MITGEEMQFERYELQLARERAYELGLELSEYLLLRLHINVMESKELLQKIEKSQQKKKPAPKPVGAGMPNIMGWGK